MAKCTSCDDGSSVFELCVSNRAPHLNILGYLLPAPPTLKAAGKMAVGIAGPTSKNLSFKTFHIQTHSFLLLLIFEESIQNFHTVEMTFDQTVLIVTTT